MLTVFLADFLGNIWFALACVGAVFGLMVVGHVMGVWSMPRMRR